MFHYEAGINWEDDTPFINTSDVLDSNRRLSYFALKYSDYSLILGKYWSSYYDIAAFTDRYMAYGAQSSGAFNSATDGSPSGTGRSDYMLQLRTNKDNYDATFQLQSQHDAFRGFETDYSYTAAGSFIYKGWENIKLGASVNYGKFDDVTHQMETLNIDGNDLSSIIGMTYQKNNYTINAVLSYTENHMSDDQGVYFDSIGAELYTHYDIDTNYRLVAGGNWLIPRDNHYDGKYSIKDLIFSFQYTFGKRTFDDLVYMEVSLPNGKLANGENRNTSMAIGLRYLLEN